MARVQNCLRQIRGLQQSSLVPFRFKSAVAEAAYDTSAETRAVGWENAKPYSEIPGPKPLPIIGNAWRFIPLLGSYGNVDFVSAILQMEKEYGPLIKLSGMPGRPDLLFVYDVNDVETVFRTEGQWPVRMGADSLEYYFCKVRKNFLVSLAASQGKEWQDFRTNINQVMMQPRNTKQYIEPIDQVSQEFIDRMRAMRDSNDQLPATFNDEVAKWSLESIAYVSLDTRFDLLKDIDKNSEAAKIIDSVRIVFETMYELDFMPSPWKYISTPTYRKFIRAMDTFTEIASKYVQASIQRLKSLPSSELQERNYSVLENLLLRVDNPNKAVSMAMDMLLAGVDTTSMVTLTVMYQLANHPEKQRKLQEELDRIIPDPSKPLTKEQLEQLKYLRACIKEVMRTQPIILGNMRNTGKDLVLGGYQVPKGTMTSMGNISMHMNENYFPRANEFLPERWLGDESLKTKHPFAFLPFGFGPRMCVGKRFADLEIETITAKFFRNFNVEWHYPPAKTEFRLLLRFVDPLKFTIKDRV